MATLGTLNELKLLRVGPEGGWLDGEAEGEALLPLQEVPASASPGQALKAFLYLDAEGRLSATTQRPLAQRGEVAYLKIL